MENRHFWKLQQFSNSGLQYYVGWASLWKYCIVPVYFLQDVKQILGCRNEQQENDGARIVIRLTPVPPCEISSSEETVAPEEVSTILRNISDGMYANLHTRKKVQLTNISSLLAMLGPCDSSFGPPCCWASCTVHSVILADHSWGVGESGARHGIHRCLWCWHAPVAPRNPLGFKSGKC